MMGWQRHQLDHMQIICPSVHRDNDARTSPLSFLQAGCLSCPKFKSLKYNTIQQKYDITIYYLLFI